MFSEAEVRATMVLLQKDAMSRGDPSTATVYAWSAIRLGNIMIERNISFMTQSERRLADRRGENGRGS